MLLALLVVLRCWPRCWYCSCARCPWSRRERLCGCCLCQWWRSKGCGRRSWWPPRGGRWGCWLGCRRCLRWWCLVAVLVAGVRFAGLAVRIAPCSHACVGDVLRVCVMGSLSALPAVMPSASSTSATRSSQQKPRPRQPSRGVCVYGLLVPRLL